MTPIVVQKRSSTPTVVAIALMLVVAVVVATRQLPARQPQPQGYERLAQADLAAQAHQDHELIAFSLAQTGEVGLYFTLQNLRTTAFELAVVGADGTSYTVMQADALRTDRRGDGQWAETLPPGEYQLLLTAAQSAGTVTVYASIP
ncbi:MAG: hypothetical protein GX579_21795 [Chloroflexi bacterium]|nr:hypothetical protein [Chloroflexota bacterium]